MSADEAESEDEGEYGDEGEYEGELNGDDKQDDPCADEGDDCAVLLRRVHEVGEHDRLETEHGHDASVSTCPVPEQGGGVANMLAPQFEAQCIISDL
ncbi:hypothetical protein DAEQUDRAFT_812709 [Daedalea quercina L-15889]|uniref:Uncharacterized protein n=1 Tax=Daedalea quercina L-15889 TaxID=1314783 RepID=A0A165P1I9_9APHY|nr:hypothetical protein DAEQUDRAFT_812709 [Daedalea quercina L-15889]